MADTFRLSFYGGVGEVTGSRHLLEAGGKRVLLDCGLFQGHRRESIEHNRQFPFKPESVDALLLSHAHIDHSGNIPLFVKAGFNKPIYCTPPTPELCRVMLTDSAHLQEEDAEFFNKIHQKDGQKIDPLYSQADVEASLALFRSQEYHRPLALSDQLAATFLNAGHVLGSAMLFLEVNAPKGKRRVLFTGDLGRRQTILMQPPEIPKNIDYLLIESTYGDRLHDPISQLESQLAEIVGSVVAERGKLLIPSFALERTQEIIFILEKLQREQRISGIPLYIDSPTAVDITAIFEKHLDCFSFDPTFKAYVAEEGDPFAFRTVHYVRTVEESRRLNDLPGPMIILSASGMCEGGRILHHLRNNIDKDNATILLVGYQAEGTLGRRLQDGADKVKIFGLEHVVRARVKTLHALSSHADKNDLVNFIQSLQPRPRKIFLVHGDPEQRSALADHLKTLGISQTEQPQFGNSFDLD